MRVFLSSVIDGLGEYRDAAERAILMYAEDQQLEISVLRSERMSAIATVPSEMCRQLVNSVDFVVGLYSDRYGYVDAQTGKSICELEAEWALERYHRPLIAFIIKHTPTDERQEKLVKKLKHFRMGVFVSVVTTPSDLTYELYRSLVVNLRQLSLTASAVAFVTQIKERDFYHMRLPLRHVTPQVSEANSAPAEDNSLENSVLRHLRAGVQMVFILGEVGSGKTWFLKGLYLTLLQAFEEGHCNPFPQFIDLGKALADLDDPSWPWDWQSLVPGDFINKFILLDAYDEAVAKSQPGARLALLQSIVSLASSSNRVVITSRTHLFETSTRLLRLVDAAKAGARPSGNLHTEVFFIDRLRDADQREFLRTEFGDRDGALWKTLTEVIDLADLAKRPILLPMVCESLPTLRTQSGADPITAGHLYRIYVERWLSREGWRLGIGTDSARRFFESLAQDFHNSGSRSVFFDELPERFPEYFPQIKFSAERERILEALRAANFLVYDLSGSYSFIHLSFIEYFLAERIVYAIKRREANFELLRFPSKVTDSFIIDLLKDEVDLTDNLTSLLHDAKSPITRYLSTYLLNRLNKAGLIADVGKVVDRLIDALTGEHVQYVTREILVTLNDLGAEIEDFLIRAHLDDPIPDEVIKEELRDYYGSLEEARRYLRLRLKNPRDDRMTLFWLISLASIATTSDMELLRNFKERGGFEQKVAISALARLSEAET